MMGKGTVLTHTGSWAAPAYKFSVKALLWFCSAHHSPSPNTYCCLQLCKSQSLSMPSDLERAMESLITVFHRYAGKEGSSVTLNRGELKTLMETELPGFLKSQKDPAAVDNIMKSLDDNRDGEVDFQEFVSLVVGLSIACETCYQMHLKKLPAKK
ncbi:hypothetical protein SKAU_G00223860 [Synaphobranchus kaupii]|uniref:EF-hand domain-containing protein n=1 Tax=Synaphobranchus kaupii TaxID=118154 RepID=A0A9Q1FB67_SYNKA|nr:hypothetical protein SKAU_G00223860 [Synaphobranchus kaupii]